MPGGAPTAGAELRRYAEGATCRWQNAIFSVTSYHN